ncbi:RidA family protein [bacterium]|nr:RidA family protein [bacterium]
MEIEEKFKKLKLPIPSLTKPVGSYIPATKAGNLVFTSGQLPITDGRIIHQGRVGKEIKLEQAQFAAKICLLNALGAIKGVIGDLDKIKKIVRVNGFVRSALDFTDQPKVLNGASDLILEVFGETKGQHTRVAIGCIELPMNACVEVDIIVEI